MYSIAIAEHQPEIMRDLKYQLLLIILFLFFIKLKRSSVSKLTIKLTEGTN